MRDDANDAKGGATPATEPGRGSATAPAAAANTAIKKDEKYPHNVLLLPLPQIVIFPDLMMPVLLDAPRVQATLDQLSVQEGLVGFVLRRDPRHDGADQASEDLAATDFHDVGTLARVVKTLKLPDGKASAVVQGLARFKIERVLKKKGVLIAKVSYPKETYVGGDAEVALSRTVQQLVRDIVQHSAQYGDEFRTAIMNIDSARMLADFAAAYFIRDAAERQALLEALDVKDRLERVAVGLTRELDLLKLGKKIQEQISDKIEKHQREFFLREQVKAIRRELGEETDERGAEANDYEQKIAKAAMTEVAEKRAREELKRLQALSPESAESGVIRGYLDWLIAIPWSRTTDDTTDIDRAARILDRDHFGLKEIKERILDFLAVRKLRSGHKGPILCFVGPPGVGKTSLGRSIADALSRRFYRMSLGGLRDEAEIRGHRRTYIGAMPGRIIQGLKTTGYLNPVFVLDEIDKIGVDFRGDPASALLEALDPEQNHAFTDLYVDVPVDLTKVLFIATANQLDSIPRPLLDRMEVIELSGYIAEEKLEIARRYLLPKVIENHGLDAGKLAVSKRALATIIASYTREAGVRNLEKSLARICRKVATRVARDASISVRVEPGDLKEFLGPPRFDQDPWSRVDRPGIAVGLAWTPVGGEVLVVEALRTPVAAGAPGGGLELTGMLGDVMLESARIAWSFARANTPLLGLASDAAAGCSIHLHVPSGAVPKDGPSAGITMATAILSLLSGRKMLPGVAMTGELTLTGRVLMVGGIRDKLLAARRAGIRRVLLPEGNRRDVDEIRPELLKGMQLEFVERYEQVAAAVFPARRGR
ncbi:MAG: endopeptidase La [Planctomycetota bacterium]